MSINVRSLLDALVAKLMPRTPRRLGSIALGLLTVGAYAASQGHYIGGGLLALAGASMGLSLALQLPGSRRGGR
jgi:hypothetical protein